MLVYFLLAIVSGLSPWVVNPAVGIAEVTLSVHEAVALPAQQQAPDELLYLSRVEAEPDAETKSPSCAAELSVLHTAAFLKFLLAESCSTHPAVHFFSAAVPRVRPTPLTILHQVFLI